MVQWGRLHERWLELIHPWRINMTTGRQNLDISCHVHGKLHNRQQNRKHRMVNQVKTAVSHSKFPGQCPAPIFYQQVPLLLPTFKNHGFIQFTLALGTPCKSNLHILLPA